MNLYVSEEMVMSCPPQSFLKETQININMLRRSTRPQKKKKKHFICLKNLILHHTINTHCVYM